ncbi:MAG: bifunctional 4-hydroxy-2-oxoglutarate aldolase/2-dehydro-3-deoxy-phosphogluconate aldolase [Paraglaciecola sp.]|uniref:bifunctional 4-hydroxy-2-oxoglutarate aldolase/2-dehydro-3-deoxy-phosphogluconate aldolase n=1 Tax=Paraglaciecola sp. TaxID=1920173 RepID=UPI0032979800
MGLTRQNITKRILAHRLVAIVRLKQQNQVAVTLKCLVDGGIEVLEITSNTPGYCEEIAKARAMYPDILIGAGTVINKQRAADAIAAGAQFLVTPNTNAAVVQIAHRHNIPVLMGAFTPTEIAQALEMEADIIKLFPAGEIGTDYLKGVQGPFDTTPFLAVGGIHLDNVEDWFAAGAAGVGVGNQLTRAIDSEQDKQDHIDFVKQFVEMVKKHRG